MNDESFKEPAEPAVGHALFVECKRHGDVIVAKIASPSIGQREAPIISAAVFEELEKPGNSPTAIVLDFRNVTFLNSMGLGMCVEIRNRISKVGGKTILYRVSDQIMSVMKMTRMDRLYTIVGDRDQLKKVLG